MVGQPPTAVPYILLHSFLGRPRRGTAVLHWLVRPGVLFAIRGVGEKIESTQINSWSFHNRDLGLELLVSAPDICIRSRLYEPDASLGDI